MFNYERLIYFLFQDHRSQILGNSCYQHFVIKTIYLFIPLVISRPRPTLGAVLDIIVQNYYPVDQKDIISVPTLGPFQVIVPLCNACTIFARDTDILGEAQLLLTYPIFLGVRQHFTTGKMRGFLKTFYTFSLRQCNFLKRQMRNKQKSMA